jgi:membrane protein DedA with SNARE-associated domain
LVAAIGWTTAGSLAGAAVLYELGGVLGPARVRVLVDRLPLLHVADLDRAEAWLHRHGPRAVLIGRMIPLVRSLVSVPAGIARMPRPQFLLSTALGSLLWNTAFISAGFALGASYHLIERYAGIASRVVLLALGLLVVIASVRRVRRSPQRREPSR